MSQIGKLYSYYLKKVFRKNWIRITVVSIFLVGVVWFAIPYLVYRSSAKFFENKTSEMAENPILSAEEKRKLQESAKNQLKEYNFRKFNHVGFGTNESQTFAIVWKINRRVLAENIKLLAEKKESGASQEELENLKGIIAKQEALDKFKLFGVDILLFNADNSFFFNQDEEYSTGKNYWKLLNDISLGNLTGFIVLFWLVFNILDSTFSNPKKDGEEAMILNFAPGVKRSDLFFGKVLSFLTFYSLINIFLFLLPYGFYCFWVGKVSVGSFALLSLYTTIIGPILFFGLVLTPYIYLNSLSGFLGGIISSLVTFFPMVWELGKNLAFKLHTWPYKVENWFFDPAWFTAISLIIGILFLTLYYWRYQEEDLV